MTAPATAHLRRLALNVLEAIAPAVFGGIVVPVLWLISPIRHIRVACIKSDRIGHIVSDVDLHMRRLQLHGRAPRTGYIFICGKPAANEQLVAMWRRKLTLVRSTVLMHIWVRRIAPAFAHSKFCEPLPMNSNEHLEFACGEPTISFTEEEKRRGAQLMRDMGVPDGAWYVCVHARDSAYLGSRAGFGLQTREATYLDCSIDNFIPAIRLIVARGGYVLRMGADVEQALPDLGPNVVDYATRFRSDFGDAYLPAHCRFFLGSTSGLFGVPLMFNVQLGITNYCPYIFSAPGRDTIYLPKLLRRCSDGKILSFPDARDLGLFDEDMARRRELREIATYDQLGLEWVENSAEDIHDFCLDLFDRTEGRDVSEEAQALQLRYRGFYSGPNASPHSGLIGPRFALRHRELIDLTAGPARCSATLG